MTYLVLKITAHIFFVKYIFMFFLNKLKWQSVKHIIVFRPNSSVFYSLFSPRSIPLCNPADKPINHDRCSVPVTGKLDLSHMVAVDWIYAYK